MRYFIKILLIIIIAAFTGCKEKEKAQKQDSEAYFYPGKVWKDTAGEPISAHGGGIIKTSDTYYWYGTNHEKGHGNKTGVSVYSSTDLYHWKNEGVGLPKDSLPVMFRDSGVCERPKVVFNDNTGKYVMWMHLDANQYQEAKAGVAVADNPRGPFTMIKIFRPVELNIKLQNRVAESMKRVRKNTFSDMNLFKDDDGKVYVFYASEDNKTMYIVRLNDQYTDIERPAIKGKNWVGILINQEREAPVPFKYKGKYYMITSGYTGWAPNSARLHVADSILGIWKTIGNPFTGEAGKKTFNSQGTYVLQLDDICSGCFIFMADRWNPDEISKSTYVWLPFYMDDDADSLRLDYYDQWNLEIFSAKEKPRPPKIQLNTKKDDFLSWNEVNNATGYRIIRNGRQLEFITDNHFEIPVQIYRKEYVYKVAASNLFEVSEPSNPIEIKSNKPQTIYLSDFLPDFWSQSFGKPCYDETFHGRKININGRIFEKGIWTHATSEIVYYISGGYDKFTAWVGCDHYTAFNDHASVSFRVIGDGMELYHSEVMTAGSVPEKVEVAVKGVNELKLVVTDGGDGTHYDHANWAEAKLVVDDK